MAASRRLRFYRNRTTNSAVRFANLENPSVEPNMECIGSTVCEIFAFKLYCYIETGVRGHWRSPKAGLFDRAHATLYSSSIVNMPLYRFRDIAAYWSKIAPLYSAHPLGVKPSDLRNSFAVENNIDGYIRQWKNFDDTFIRFVKHACDRRTHRRIEGIAMAYMRYNMLFHVTRDVQ